MRKSDAAAASGSPDLAWAAAADAQFYAAGDVLPGGLHALPGWDHDDVVLWVEHHRAIVVGGPAGRAALA